MKSAAWRMPWQKSENDDVGGVNPRLFPAGFRTEHKGRRRRLRFYPAMRGIALWGVSYVAAVSCAGCAVPPS